MTRMGDVEQRLPYFLLGLGQSFLLERKADYQQSRTSSGHDGRGDMKQSLDWGKVDMMLATVAAAARSSEA